MIHQIDMSWVQLILIEIGVALLLVAMWAVIRETSAYRGRRLPKTEGAQVHHDDLEYQMPERAEPAHPDPAAEKSFDEDSHPETKAGNLTRTSKVKFVQSFKFRRHGT